MAMDSDIERALKRAFPGEDARYFAPMSVGNNPASADEGAAAILAGTKTDNLILILGLA
jgi:hypothetical protein